MEYNGYYGSIEYSVPDHCFFGEVLGLIKEIGITYEGDSLNELFLDFKAGVDHYLASCRENGIIPEKPRKSNRARQTSQPIFASLN